MAEASAPVPVPQVAAPVAAGRGRGRGKAKAKGKKGKMKVKKVIAEGEEAAPKVPKAPKVNLRMEVENSVGDRNIEDVIKEARAKVDELQAAVQKAQEAEITFETSILGGKTKMEEASAKVDTCVHKETMALEKFKAAKQSLIETQKKLSEKKLAAGEEERALEILSGEGDKNKQEVELLQAKEDAKKATEDAKKAYQEAIAKAKLVQEEIKAKRNALCLTDDPEAEAKAKVAAERAAEEAAAKKEAKHLGSVAAKDLNHELKELEKQRAARDKERAQAFKEAAGLGKAKKPRGDGAAASPAKVAKIQDVD